VGLELMMSKDGTTSNRGFGFLEFYNHACADNARKQLTDSSFK
jgi:heterogeneous nuclear ribonucleoprotein R